MKCSARITGTADQAGIIALTRVELIGGGYYFFNNGFCSRH